jgi:hypothetical protein
MANMNDLFEVLDASDADDLNFAIISAAEADVVIEDCCCCCCCC